MVTAQSKNHAEKRMIMMKDMQSLLKFHKVDMEFQRSEKIEVID